MPDTVLNVVFDGVADVPRLPAQSAVEFFDSFMGYYSVFEGNAANRLVANVSFTDGDWRVVAMRFGSASPDGVVNISETDASTGRRIDLLQLGYNSNVELATTSVRYIWGWDGDLHDVTLGESGRSVLSVELAAAVNRLTTGGDYVHSIDTYGQSFIIIGSGGAGRVQTSNENDRVTIEGFVEMLKTKDGNDRVIVNGSVEALRTGDGKDKVTTGDGYVNLIQTGDGKDEVRLGEGGTGFVRLGAGNDTLFVSETDPAFGVVAQGGGGTDTLNFSQITSTGVVVSLNLAAQFQNIGDPGGDVNGPPVIGYLSESQFENLVGTRRDDVLIGDGGRNVIEGANGNDTIRGLGGRDEIFGGAGNDRIEGGRGNDILNGQGGIDVFVFGANSGTDQILDYQDGRDLMEISDHVGGFASLVISDDSGDRVIDHDGGTIRLVGEAGLNLMADDFAFV